MYMGVGNSYLLISDVSIIVYIINSARFCWLLTAFILELSILLFSSRLLQKKGFSLWSLIFK